MVAEKQDANFVGLYRSRESALAVLPANPVFDTREPNSFDDLGGDYTSVARRPFSPSRQRKKGSITDLDADGGWNEDLTQNNMQEVMESFFYAALRVKGIQETTAAFTSTFTAAAGTDRATVNGHGLATGDGPFRLSNAGGALPAGLVAGTDYWVVVDGVNTFQFATSRANAIAGIPAIVDITDNGTGVHTIARPDAVSAASDEYTVNETASFMVGHLILASGFAIAGNNGLKELDTVSPTKLGVTGALFDEVGASDGKIEIVGYQFPADDVSLALVGGTAVLTSAATDLNELGLIPGEWTFLGGDAAGNRFGDVVPGYARVKSIADDGSSITFDKTTFAIGAGDDGAGTALQMFFGTVVKNEDDPDLIVRFTDTIERTLGRDDDGMQSEVIPGFAYNEMTWNSPLADKVNIDLGGIGMSHKKRTGLEGPLSKLPGATIEKQRGEDAFNTSSNVYRLRMAVIDEATLNPSPLFARVTEWNVTINNNVSANKAQGTLGAFDTTAGNFDVDGEFTCYFSTVAAIKSIEDNADVTFDAIYSKDNAAVIMDIPLLGTGGGKLNVEQDQAIMLPLNIMGAESPFGHTALLNWLSYVPNVGMATGG